MKDWHLLLHDKQTAKAPATLRICAVSLMPLRLSQSMVVDIHVCSYPINPLDCCAQTFEERLCACAVSVIFMGWSKYILS